MSEDDYVTEALCHERCKAIKKISKMADKNLEDWLKSLDTKFWAIIIVTILSLLSSVGALLLIILKGMK
jgi:hypothetical protein